MIDILITCPRCGAFKAQGRDLLDGETAEHYTNKVLPHLVAMEHAKKDMLCRSDFKVEFFFPKDTPIGGIPYHEASLTEPPEM